jgi:SAM-dependent methyltransferase
MVAKRQVLGRVLRDTGLLDAVDKLRYVATLARVSGRNRRFIAEHAGFALPPKVLAYDAYSAPDWPFYMRSGLETAAYLAGLARQYAVPVGAIKALEWGCGPARVIRHLPRALGPGPEVHGSDYNEASIEWCRAYIPDVAFVQNELQPTPPLPFEDGYFDFLYSISVFTHLAEGTSQLWMDELARVTRPRGVLVITTNGDSLQTKMLPDELRSYQATGIAIRGNIREGKKMFSACHSPTYLRGKLFRNLEVLEHLPAGFPFTAQDCWVLRKP